MDYKKFSAKTVDEAITKACLELSVTSTNLDYTVIDEGSNGFLGIGRREAVINARIKEEEVSETVISVEKEVKSEVKPEIKEEVKSEVKPEAKPEVKEDKRPRIKTAKEIEARALAAAKASGEKVTSEKENKKKNFKENKKKNSDRNFEKKEIIESAPKPEREIPVKTEEEIAKMIEDADTFLKGVFAAMELEVEMKINYDPATGYLSCDFEGPEMGIIIGKRGQTLDSLQYLTSLVVNKNQKDYVRVKLDTEEYRKRRKETLENLSKNIAYKVKKSRRSVALEPMNPYERRIIHAALQGNKFVTTYSEGEEPYRKVVIAYKRNK